jgi:very-short-patch-repair endonuclease
MTVLYNKSKNLGKRILLRRNQTPQEIVLWSRLRRESLGLKFKRQYSAGPYENKDYDTERTAYLNTLNIKVLRFWNNEINVNIDGVILKIINELNYLPLLTKERD